MRSSRVFWALIACLQAPRARCVPLFDHEVKDIDVSYAHPDYRRSLPVPISHPVHERHHEEHVEGWTKIKRAQPYMRVAVRIGLKQENEAKGHEMLMKISDPESPDFGKHLSSDQVVELFAPLRERVHVVKRWLVSEGVREQRISLSANKQWLQLDMSVAALEKLLKTEYHIFEHEETGSTSLACSEYRVPWSMQRHIDYISPGIQLRAARSRKSKRSNHNSGSGQRSHPPRQVSPDLAYLDAELSQSPKEYPCSTVVTPECVRAHYQLPNNTKATPGNELGVFQSLSQHYFQEDLDAYWQEFAPWVTNGTHPELRAINGAYGPTNKSSEAGQEADLDFEIVNPLIWPQKSVLWQTDDEWYEIDQGASQTKYNGFFNTLFDAIDGSYCTMSAYGQTGNCNASACLDPVYPNPNAPAPNGYQGPLMCGAYKPTNVIVISYSGVEHVLPDAYMRRQCLEILKLGLQGVTVVESSGDHGVGGQRGDPYIGCLGPQRQVFSPRTMSNCPYVLSVGATMLVPASTSSGNSNSSTNGTTTSKKKTSQTGLRPESGEENQQPAFIETATTRFASGGGFSNVFQTPTWQIEHVQRYLQRSNMSRLGYVGGWGQNSSRLFAQQGKVFNKAGRGYPDVSAIGDNYVVVTGGSYGRMGGTSVAAPIWASVLTLINEERLAAGKGPVGFVHPVLYNHPEVFTDITNGFNPGCGSSGFPAREGWDPVTGLGTPNFPKLLDLYMRLP